MPRDLSSLFGSFLGGTNNGEGIVSDLALDAAGGVYVTGQTMSADFPTTPGAFDRVVERGSDDLLDRCLRRQGVVRRQRRRQTPGRRHRRRWPR